MVKGLLDLCRLFNYVILVSHWDWLRLSCTHVLLIWNRMKSCILVHTKTKPVYPSRSWQYHKYMYWAHNDRRTVIYFRSDQTGGQSIITEMFADKIHRELKDLLIKTCEQANERCSKVISARSKVYECANRFTMCDNIIHNCSQIQSWAITRQALTPISGK